MEWDPGGATNPSGIDFDVGGFDMELKGEITEVDFEAGSFSLDLGVNVMPLRAGKDILQKAADLYHRVVVVHMFAGRNTVHDIQEADTPKRPVPKTSQRVEQ